MIKTEDPIVRGILGRSKPGTTNVVNWTGALALARAGAIITQHRSDAGTSQHQYWMALPDGEQLLSFKYSGENALLNGKRQKEINQIAVAWFTETASPDEREAFKDLLHGEDNVATAQYLRERVDLPLDELTLYVADLNERQLSELLAIVFEDKDSASEMDEQKPTDTDLFGEGEPIRD